MNDLSEVPLQPSLSVTQGLCGKMHKVGLGLGAAFHGKGSRCAHSGLKQRWAGLEGAASLSSFLIPPQPTATWWPSSIMWFWGIFLEDQGVFWELSMYLNKPCGLNYLEWILLPVVKNWPTHVLVTLFVSGFYSCIVVCYVSQFLF